MQYETTVQISTPGGEKQKVSLKNILDFIRFLKIKQVNYENNYCSN